MTFESNANESVRALHLDLKGVPPSAHRLVELVKIISAAGYNAIVAEWEDSFPWTIDPRFRSETAYTVNELKEFCSAAKKYGIELIPLVQCLGHMETVLSKPGYEGLRELAGRSDCLNPLAQGSRELVERMVDDVLSVLGSVRYFHLGGDEAWSFGMHPETKCYIEKHGKDQLYLYHVEPILDKLNDKGIRPILWHDMMIEWREEILKELGNKADLCVWGYDGHPDTTDGHYNIKYIERFRDCGLTLWGATAYKGGDGADKDLPDFFARQFNASAWSEVALRYGFAGMIATGWSRYSTVNVQCEPIESALDSLFNVGAILRDGRAVEGGIDSCLSLLEEVGERGRFEKCKKAMMRLAQARKECWRQVIILREYIVTGRMDDNRRGLRPNYLDLYNQALAELEAAGEQMREAFSGLIEGIWINRYLGERIEPIRQELEFLEKNSDGV